MAGKRKERVSARRLAVPTAAAALTVGAVAATRAQRGRGRLLRRP